MSSDNFQLQSDSINFAGGRATSDSYLLEATVGEIATGESFSDNYQLRAGYQQMQETYLAMFLSDEVILTPPLQGLTGGFATGSISVRTVTDNRAGYEMTIVAERTPAMQSALSVIGDYTPVGTVPDYSFELPTAEARFGYAVSGPDTAVRFQASAGTCGVAGTATGTTCWDGLATTSQVIARALDANHPSGATTTVHFQVGIGALAGVLPGNYVATSTITVTAQ